MHPGYDGLMDILGILVALTFGSQQMIFSLPEAATISYLKETNRPETTFGNIVESGINVLGVSDTANHPDITPTPESNRETNETAAYPKTRKSDYTIALVGDSMIDTLGSDLKELQEELKKSYPRVNFRLLNRGVGAENIDSGLWRLTNSYNYLGIDYPAVVREKADIVVIESFGYNPYSFDEGAIDKHWLKLAQMRDVIKSQLPQSKVLIAVTIAPNANVFGDGAPGVSFSDEGKRQKVATIKKYLESTVKFAAGEKLPLADAYHPSLDKSGNGYEKLINAGDNIHYSPLGRKLMAEKIVEAIVENKMLE